MYISLPSNSIPEDTSAWSIDLGNLWEQLLWASGAHKQPLKSQGSMVMCGPPLMVSAEVSPAGRGDQECSWFEQFAAIIDVPNEKPKKHIFIHIPC